jgi:general L-amino acid transport system permease protein
MSVGAVWRRFHDARVRAWVSQAAVAGALCATIWYFVANASENMVKAGIASGFGFLWRTSGIDVPFRIVDYTPQGDILDLLWVGVSNTLLVSLIGVARLSRNFLLRNLAGGYVEFVRNIPLLLFVFFWYFGVIRALPPPRGSWDLGGIAFLNNRGLYVPAPQDAAAFAHLPLVLALAVAAFWLLRRWARARQAATGEAFPVWIAGLVLLAVAPLVALAYAAATTVWDVPALRGFNFRGGFVLIPEFVALFAALVTYTAGFVAEVVRGGILAVGRGQKEAAASLGLTPGQTLRLVVIPQAMRVMVPPMTSQYLNLLKNSSFGAAIAYPEIVSVFMGSALNATGQAIEIIAITLAIYLSIGLAVSMFMNWYNARIALVAR